MEKFSENTLLNTIITLKKRSGVYFGNNYITNFYDLLNGFIFCLDKYGFSKEHEFFDNFEAFVMQKYNVTHTNNYSKIIEFYSEDLNDAKDNFCKIFDEYMEEQVVDFTYPKICDSNLEKDERDFILSLKSCKFDTFNSLDSYSLGFNSALYAISDGTHFGSIDFNKFVRVYEKMDKNSGAIINASHPSENIKIEYFWKLYDLFIAGEGDKMPKTWGINAYKGIKGDDKGKILNFVKKHSKYFSLTLINEDFSDCKLAKALKPYFLKRVKLIGWFGYQNTKKDILIYNLTKESLEILDKKLDDLILNKNEFVNDLCFFDDYQFIFGACKQNVVSFVNDEIFKTIDYSRENIMLQEEFDMKSWKNIMFDVLHGETSAIFIG